MSAESQPITPARFAAALKDLPLSSLHLKLLELRNSIAHLDYSNEQLRPYAEGIATAFSPSSPPASQSEQSQSQSQTYGPEPPQPRGEPDQDCIDAIKENEQVIERMQERIRLVRAEVESRGLSWDAFQGQTDDGEKEKTNKDIHGADAEMVNGTVNGTTDREEGQGQESGSTATTTTTTTTTTSSSSSRHPAWSDGTFQTGVIRGGVLQMDAVAGSRAGTAEQQQQRQGQRQAGGSLTDEELRRRMEEQLRGLGRGDDDGEDDGEGGLHL
ncbi:hypothetical protein VTK26DRAFT_172 [Humicola hyalothermophila]